MKLWPIILAGSVAMASGANWFVKPGGGSTGADWSHPASLYTVWGSASPGDSVYMAGSNYNVVQFPITASGTAANRVYLKRATAADTNCSGTAGWSSAYDTQVVFTTLTNAGSAAIQIIGRDYISIEGVVPNGIKINVSSPAQNGYLVQTDDIYGIRAVGNGLEFHNLEISGPNVPSITKGIFIGDNGQYGLGTKTGEWIHNCYIHGLGVGIFQTDVQYGTNELNEIAFTYTSAYNHDDIVYHNNGQHWVYRWNYIHDFPVMGLYFCDGFKSNPIDYIEVYGNLIVGSPGQSAPGNGQAIFLDPWNQGGQGPYQYGPHWYVYNNTIANCFIAIRNDGGHFGPGGTGTYSSSSTGGVATNNLFFFGGYYSWGTWTNDYSFSNGSVGGAHSIANGSNPFIDYAGLNYRPVSTVSSTLPRGKGASVGLTTDAFGTAWANPPTIGYAEVSGAITNYGQLQLSASAYSVNKSGVSVTITASRTGGSTGLVGCSLTTSDGTAAAGVNYTATNGTLSFADGVTSSSFTIPILNVSSNNGNKTFTVALSTASGGATLTPPTSATVTIIDDYLPPTVPNFTNSWLAADMLITAPMVNSGGWVSQSSQTLSTNTAGSLRCTFKVSSTGLYTLNCTLDAEGDANNSLFLQIDSPLGSTNDVSDIYPYVTNAVGLLSWRGTGTFDNNQFYPLILDLTNGVSYGMTLFGREALTGISNVVLTAYAPPVSQTVAWQQYPYSVQTSGPLSLTVVRTNGNTGTATVAYATADGTALAGRDYTSTSGTITMGPGVDSATVAVTISYQLAPTNRAFNVVLSSPTGCVLTDPSMANVTITGTPTPQYTLSVASIDPNSGVTVSASPADQSGTAGGSTLFSLTYLAGSSVTLTAPGTAGTNVFSKWVADGVDLTTNVTATFSMNQGRSLMAVYGPSFVAPTNVTLTVNSTPSTMFVLASPSDTSGAYAGFTPFTFTYALGTTATVTAQATVNNYAFVKWQLNGIDATTNLSQVIALAANATASAIYAPIPGPPVTINVTVRNATFRNATITP